MRSEKHIRGLIACICLLGLFLIPESANAWKLESASIALPATQGGGATYHSVAFRQTYDTVPLVFATATEEGGDPCSISIKNVTTAGFDVAQVEPTGNDGTHIAMTVDYFAIEPGTHYFCDGTMIVAGSISTTTMQYGRGVSGGEGWVTVNFAPAFNFTPAVLAMIQTANNETADPPNEPPVPWLTTAMRNVSKNSMQLALERSEVAVGTVSVNETIGYVAMEAPRNGQFFDSGSDAIKYETIRSADNIRGWDNGCYVTNFNNVYTSNPRVVATSNRHDGGDGGWLRRCSLDTTGVGLTYDEDRYRDSERSHTTEAAGIYVFSESFDANIGIPDLTTTVTTVTPASPMECEGIDVTIDVEGVGSCGSTDRYDFTLDLYKDCPGSRLAATQDFSDVEIPVTHTFSLDSAWTCSCDQDSYCGLDYDFRADVTNVVSSVTAQAEVNTTNNEDSESVVADQALDIIPSMPAVAAGCGEAELCQTMQIINNDTETIENTSISYNSTVPPPAGLLEAWLTFYQPTAVALVPPSPYPFPDFVAATPVDFKLCVDTATPGVGSYTGTVLADGDVSSECVEQVGEVISLNKTALGASFINGDIDFGTNCNGTNGTSSLMINNVCATKDIVQLDYAFDNLTNGGTPISGATITPSTWSGTIAMDGGTRTEDFTLPVPSDQLPGTYTGELNVTITFDDLSQTFIGPLSVEVIAEDCTAPTNICSGAGGTYEIGELVDISVDADDNVGLTGVNFGVTSPQGFTFGPYAGVNGAGTIWTYSNFAGTSECGTYTYEACATDDGTDPNSSADTCAQCNFSVQPTCGDEICSDPSLNCAEDETNCLDCCVDADEDTYYSASCLVAPEAERDCDDNDVLINPAGTEICGDSADNDCNGDTDCEDVVCADEPECEVAPPEPEPEPEPEPDPELNPPVGSKSVSDDEYPILNWQMIWINSPASPASLHLIHDPIPDGTEYVEGSLSCDAQGMTTTTRCEYDTSFNRIVWEGSIGEDLGAATADDAENELIISFNTTVSEAMNSVVNTALGYWDLNDDGIIDDSDPDPVEVSATWAIVECTLETDENGDGRPDAVDAEISDYDANGIPDCCEVSTSPAELLSYDSDGDGFWDCFEYEVGANPMDEDDLNVQGSGLSLPNCSLNSQSDHASAGITAALLIIGMAFLGIMRLRKCKSEARNPKF
jgi:hypothetical protein